MKARIRNLLPAGSQLATDYRLIRLMFANGLVAPSVVWLVGNFVDVAFPVLIEEGNGVAGGGGEKRAKEEVCSTSIW